MSRADAIFNVQRTAVLLQAITAGRFDALREALRDRLHQPYRAPLVPGLDQALAFEHPALLGVFLSWRRPVDCRVDARRRAGRRIDVQGALRGRAPRGLRRAHAARAPAVR